MPKREAQERVDRGDLTWGHLKHDIEQAYDADDLNGPSVVNGGITKRQSLDILYAALAPKEDNELVQSPRYQPRTNAKNSLIAVNVLRESAR